MSRTVSYIFGAVLAIVGLWGFVSTPILGLFDVTMIHSVVHLVSGIILLAVAAWWTRSSAMALKVFGVIYAVVAIWGFVVPGPILGLIDNTLMDNVLHVVLAVVFLWVGFADKGERAEMAATM